MIKVFVKHILFFAAAILSMTAAVSCSKGTGYIQLQGYAQGGTYSVKLNMKDVSEKPENIKKAVDSLLNVIDTTLSGYNKASQLSRFNEGTLAEPGAMFKDIYSRSRHYYEETDGALDVAAGPLFDAWGFGFKNDSLPSAAVVDSLLNVCGMKTMDAEMKPLDPSVHPVLNFNAVAQGYSCDVIAEYLHSIGVKDMLVDIGEIFCEGVNPEGNPWKVGVDRPVDGNMTPGADLDGIWMSDGSACGIVTSGNYRKFYEKDGKKYSHTIDPRTGYPVQHSLLSATIVAQSATDADAYATYCMVIGLDEARNFIESRPDLEGYLIYDSHGEMKEWASSGFKLVAD